MRKLPIGIQNFEYLRSNDFKYVDNAELVGEYRAAEVPPAEYVFASRFTTSYIINGVQIK
jgi:siderophore synthetase component